MGEADSPYLKFAPVGAAEAGQKLLRFLERRLNLPPALLHRWLRTGQIRLNGKRCKPFELVQEGDEVRLPPFAFRMAIAAQSESPVFSQEGLPPLIAAHNDIWVFNKPAGLLAQPGSPGERSMAALLAERYQNYAFKPAPAHRLDKETSGILLVGATFEALRYLAESIKNGAIHKEYLAWCDGIWPHSDDILLRHYLTDGDKPEAFPEPGPGRKTAECIIRPLFSGSGRTLLQIRLLTGRKRQIRLQLAACGRPVSGDSRYGNAGSGLKLHSARVVLPDGAMFESLPDWSGEFAVASLPDMIPEPT